MKSTLYGIVKGKIIKPKSIGDRRYVTEEEINNGDILFFEFGSPINDSYSDLVVVRNENYITAIEEVGDEMIMERKYVVSGKEIRLVDAVVIKENVVYFGRNKFGEYKSHLMEATTR